MYAAATAGWSYWESQMHRKMREKHVGSYVGLCVLLVAVVLVTACDTQAPATMQDPASARQATRCQEQAIRETGDNRSLAPPGENSEAFEECMEELGYRCREGGGLPSTRQCDKDDFTVYNPYS